MTAFGRKMENVMMAERGPKPIIVVWELIARIAVVSRKEGSERIHERKQARVSSSC